MAATAAGNAQKPIEVAMRVRCNFGVLFPWWNMLFGTASWTTGIRDQLPAALGSGRDYGAGLWAQQWLALGRIRQRLRAAQGGSPANPAL